MKTFDQCCREVAKEKWPDSLEWQDLLAKSLSCAEASQAAHLYAQEKLKRLLEVAKQEAAQWQTKSDKENDILNKAVYSMTAYAVNRIATRIEELIAGSKCRFHGAVNYTNTRGVIMCGHCEKPIDHAPPAHETHEPINQTP